MQVEDTQAARVDLALDELDEAIETLDDVLLQRYTQKGQTPFQDSGRERPERSEPTHVASQRPLAAPIQRPEHGTLVPAPDTTYASLSPPEAAPEQLVEEAIDVEFVSVYDAPYDAPYQSAAAASPAQMMETNRRAHYSVGVGVPPPMPRATYGGDFAYAVLPFEACCAICAFVLAAARFGRQGAEEDALQLSHGAQALVDERVMSHRRSQRAQADPTVDVDRIRVASAKVCIERRLQCF